TLPADGPIGRSRGHRLTTLLQAPMGAWSKTTSTQQPSNMLTKNESAKNSGHYPEVAAVAAGDDAFLKELVEDRFMKSPPLPRGEQRCRTPFCGGSRARREGTRAGRGLRQPGERLRASD